MDEEEEERNGSKTIAPVPVCVKPAAGEGQAVKDDLWGERIRIEVRAAGEANAGSGCKSDRHEREPPEQFTGDELPSAHAAQDASEPPRSQESLRADAAAAVELLFYRGSYALDRKGRRFIESCETVRSNAERKFEIVGQLGSSGANRSRRMQKIEPSQVSTEPMRCSSELSQDS